MENALPEIPPKRYFTIGEVSELCGVKPYVLRYWEQEFSQLRPMKRRGNRRYYQHHEVLLIRRIRDLLYEQGFTISGARNRLTEVVPSSLAESAGFFAQSSHPDDSLLVDDKMEAFAGDARFESIDMGEVARDAILSNSTAHLALMRAAAPAGLPPLTPQVLRQELQSIKELLDTSAEHQFAGILSVSVGV
jgi:DNA-binding transcriptional MerR regulator